MRKTDAAEPLVVLGLMVLFICIFFFRVWLVMLVLGAVHTYWEFIPPLGFAGAMWVTVLGTLLTTSTAPRD